MPIVTKINTIRHAKTTYSMENRYAGSNDVPLSEIGIQDASEASEKLSGITFDIVLTSTLKRSIETAHLLIGNGTQCIQNDLCNERNFGVMEGLTRGEVQELDPPVLFVEVGNDLHSVNPKDGEPFEDVWERAKKFRRFLFKEHIGSNVLIVSHGVFLQLFQGVLRGLNCIESLSTAYPSTLDLSSFHFSDNNLVFEKVMRFTGSDEKSF
ncbi:MAG: histidine phosphatase family protein [Anaerolineales bacterium]|nr:histidine phosphatase family protein [Anaerolineales bacterium]